ncbi:MAG: potassium channel protein [Nitrospinae bacterium]|nr:potassium channel protein [Nitrospinota bacterium]
MLNKVMKWRGKGAKPRRWSGWERRMAFSLLLVLTAMGAGVAGYMAIEGWNFRDSLFMTVITLATIGYGETHPLSNDGRDFTIILIFLGVGTMAYVVNNAVRVIFEGEWQKTFGRRKLENRLDKMSGHIIICGYGRMGRVVSNELLAKKLPHVIIEQSPMDSDADGAVPVIMGDATQDEILKLAGIDRAVGIISVLSTDAHNLYLVLSARGMNPNIRIVARAGEEGAEQKLLRAGADRVVSPYQYGGVWMANMIVKPAVVNFLEFATRIGNQEFQIEEVLVGEGSSLDGKSIMESAVNTKLGVIVAAIKTQGAAEMKFNPSMNTVVKSGDILVVIGDSKKLAQLETLAKKR